MLKTPWYRRAGWCIAVFFILLTGSHLAMSAPLGDASDYRQPPAPTKEVPLRFAAHNFGAYCYNTQRCSVIYNNKDFARLDNDSPTGPRESNYLEYWSAG
jgi:hypothetical protein